MLSIVIFAFGVIFIMAGFFTVASSDGSDGKMKGLGILILCLGYSMFSCGINMTIKEGDQNHVAGSPGPPAAV